jgi:TonB family protein
MFETSTIRAQAQVATGRLSLLSVSVIAHTAILVGAVAVSVASVDFPAMAPDEYSRAPFIATVQIPPPLGNPNAGVKPRQPESQPVQKPPVNQLTAPSTLPDTVKPVDQPSSGTGDSNTNTTGGTVDGPEGVPWGTEKSIGDLDAPPVVDAPPVQPQVEERIYQAHEVVAPVLLAKVEPRYPQSLLRAAPAATVVVRCIIDKSGSVRDPEVIVPAALAPFNAEVVRVVSQWRYKPATYAGRSVDSYLTLTVHFAVKR